METPWFWDVLGPPAGAGCPFSTDSFLVGRGFVLKFDFHFGWEGSLTKEDYGKHGVPTYSNLPTGGPRGGMACGWCTCIWFGASKRTPRRSENTNGLSAEIKPFLWDPQHVRNRTVDDSRRHFPKPGIWNFVDDPQHRA